MERMMRIHAAIAGKGHPNASTLARELEVTSKTIQRDLEFMRDRMNLPLEYVAALNGYVYTEEVDAFPTLQITEGELFAMMVAEKALQQYRGTPFEKRLVGAFRKLAQSLPETVSVHVADWEQTVSFRTTAEPVVNLPVMDAVAQAMQRRRQLRLTYRKPGSPRAEERVVDPYHLANVNGDWYLFAFDHLRKDLRTFVPSRIVSVEPTGATFKRPDRSALEQRLADSFNVHSKEGDYSVVVRFDESVADYIREKRWHPSQKLAEIPGGGVELRLRLGSLQEIHRWILGWGGAVEVLEPRELVRSVVEAATLVVRRHSKSGLGG
jgi:proteasome accessory factor B